MTIYDNIPKNLLKILLEDVQKERSTILFRLKVVNEAIRQLRKQIKSRK